MKKILAILCGATMMFAACTPGGEESVTPIFPESQSFELLAGAAQRLVFDANTAWTVSLENDYYAQLSYNNGEGTVFDTEVSGVAGEGITVRVIMNEVIKNYDADVVFPVYIKMGSTTQTLATILVKTIERPAAISLPSPDPDVTFKEGGHPNWSPFKNAQHTYHMNYASQRVIEGIRLDCGLDTDYSIKTYAYTEGASDPVEFTTREDSWLTITDGMGENGNGFMVAMDLSKESAQWSWFDTQYESYVNFEDAEGNVLVSIFCTSTYKPAPSTGGDTTAESIVKMGQSPAKFVSGGHPSWGGEFASAEIKYALTFADEYDCADGVSLKHSLEGVAAYKAYGYNAGLVIQEVNNDSYITIDSDYDGGMFVVRMDLTAPMAQSSHTEGVGYEGYVNLVDAEGNVLASIYCLYNPTAQGGGAAGGDVVALVNESMASAIGVTLTKIESTDADYNAAFGADYGVTNAPQYRLTYSQLGALTMPQYAALNIPGFGFGQVTGEYQINGENRYGSQIFSVWNNPDAGGVVVEPMADYGFTAETIPAGKYEIAIYGSSYSPIARIVLELNPAQ
jgi:hypothetical protein